WVGAAPAGSADADRVRKTRAAGRARLGSPPRPTATIFVRPRARGHPPARPARPPRPPCRPSARAPPPPSRSGRSAARPPAAAPAPAPAPAGPPPGDAPPAAEPVPAGPIDPRRPLDARQQRWVDSTLASLPLRARVAQLVMPWVLGDYVSDGSAAWSTIRGWVV